MWGKKLNRKNGDELLFTQILVKKILVGFFMIPKMRPFPTNDMQTPPSPLSFDSIFIEGAQCAETNEKLIFQFLFFELS